MNAGILTAGSVYAAYESQLPEGSLPTQREAVVARRESIVEEKILNNNRLRFTALRRMVQLRIRRTTFGYCNFGIIAEYRRNVFFPTCIDTSRSPLLLLSLYLGRLRLRAQPTKIVNSSACVPLALASVQR